jgi:hypothetical protein
VVAEIRATCGRSCTIILDMTTTMHRTAEITVSLPPEQAMALFTPEGERRWAEGWDPHYPHAGRREGPGTVFTTSHGSHLTTWVMVDHGPERIRYTRVVHGMTAGMIAVEVLGSQKEATHVRVTYDLTALSAAGESWLEAFDAGYEAEIAAWSTEIAAALARSARVPAAG